jgi:hypothetical protein
MAGRKINGNNQYPGGPLREQLAKVFILMLRIGSQQSTDVSWLKYVNRGI